MASSSHVSDLRIQNSSNDTVTPQQQGCTNARKVGRGRTTGLSIAKKKRKSDTGKLHVIIPDDKMVAVGPGAADFVTEISVIVQKYAPFNVEKWKSVPNAVKERIVTKVLDSFHIDGANVEHTKEVILETAKRLYRNHRCKLHEHFNKYETPEKALENKPRDLSLEDWEYLVNYFSSSKFKEISTRNKLNKSKQVNNHTCGRKSFQAVSFEKRDPETQKEPNFQDLWQITHTKKGEWVDEASKEVHMKVQEAALEKLEGINEETAKDQIVNEVFQSVVGQRSGYCRGLGAGIQPTRGRSVTGLHEELTNERGKRQTIEMKLKAVETQLQEERVMREEMAARFEESQRQILESQRTIQQTTDRPLEERMASFFFRMHTFSGGQASIANNNVSKPDDRVEATAYHKHGK